MTERQKPVTFGVFNSTAGKFDVKFSGPLGHGTATIRGIAANEQAECVMGRLTLLQEKNRPIHKLTPATRKSVVARTFCGVDPCRKGIRTEGVNVGQSKATCKACLKIEAETVADTR